ncbi:Peptidyl-prolyl cis-trans isomerase FKBP65 (PPIase FKBP65) (70 kDa peptidyl-prolyl isomerase) (FK506-binding protein 65) (AtFKBP65) (Immunophilin FKBP65) (Peptidyl-prolyl isomerase ROF2) (Protein ROTAMASE FKBP 2) (Rotamase) [Durusdinium trenchii]|uniref:peptidylprolyl isomerase n=1 Tax=Durusdinium trenchii TaxID=1381693 RepID=A0ABP0KGJ7_9DINO
MSKRSGAEKSLRSADGSTLFSYTADSGSVYGTLGHYPAGQHSAGAKRPVWDWDSGKYLGEIDEAPYTYNVIGNLNEHGLAIGETTFGGNETLSGGEGVMDYGSLIWVTLQRCKTAREAILMFDQLVKEYGYVSEGESFTIADAKEAGVRQGVWVLEMIGKGKFEKGAVWVAVRIPDGHVSGHANQARIQRFPLHDAENCVFSSDVISFAVKVGLWDAQRPQEEFSFADAYDPISFTGARLSDARVWSFFSSVALDPSFEKSYEKHLGLRSRACRAQLEVLREKLKTVSQAIVPCNSGRPRRAASRMLSRIGYVLGQNVSAAARMPLSIPVKSKISNVELMSHMRNHYEGTALDSRLDVGAGSSGSPFRVRPLVWKQGNASYVHERMVGTPQALLMKSIVSVLLMKAATGRRCTSHAPPRAAYQRACRVWVALGAMLTALTLRQGKGTLPAKGPCSFVSPGWPDRLPLDRFVGVRAVDERVENEVDDFYDEDNEELMKMLMSGTGDEVDLLGNGSLIKTIISPAPAFSRRPQLGDEVTVHFVGSLEDGSVFDDTRARHEPYTFRVGLGFVIGGWDKGIPTMMKGERSLFTMDSSVAYGANGAGYKIPPNATVRFDIELLGWEEIDDMGPDDVEPEWEAPLVGRNDVGEGGKDPFGQYSWVRNGLEVIVKLQLPDDTRPKDVAAEFFPQRVSVAVKGSPVLSGTPAIDLDWEECYWDINREEEIQDDPQAKLWLLIHLHKKDAEKVRWPDHLLEEHLQLESSFSSSAADEADEADDTVAPLALPNMALARKHLRSGGGVELRGTAAGVAPWADGVWADGCDAVREDVLEVRIPSSKETSQAGLLWFGVDDASFSVHAPFHGGTTRVPQGYADGFGDALHYSRSAFWAFNTVANFIYPRLRPMPASPGIRCLYIAGFRGHFSSLDGFLSFFLFEILDL